LSSGAVARAPAKATPARKVAPSRRGSRPPIDKGVTVQVLAGPFVGKVGVVQELDGKGGARVVLGTMSSWVPLVDLTHESTTGARPPFRSSHRRPGK
jgi:hypothetical protein